jgi:DNA-binding PucR family transcriptional regulator
VHAALRGQDVREPNFASVTGYRLAQLHLAVVAWADGESEVGMDALERTARIAAAELGGVGEPLVLPAGRQSLWAWVGLGDRRRGARVRMPSAEHLGADSTRLAIGLPDANLAGFVRSHERAQAARKLAVEGRLADRIVWYGQEGVAIASLLRRDPVAADQWVRDVLGDLDGPDPALAELRETLRVFLTSGSSYVRTAERLTLHRNTVRYRVTRALDRLPSHTDGLLGRSTDILVALQLRALVGNHGRH